MMSWRVLVCSSLALVGASCGVPAASVRSAIGIRVMSVTIESVEGAPVRIEDAKRLRALVALLDRHRLTELATEQPTTSCRAVGDVTITLRAASRDRIACVHLDDDTFSHVVLCPFFESAHTKGFVANVPSTCVGDATRFERPCAVHESP